MERKVAIVGGGMYRADSKRYEVAEEAVAMALKEMMRDVPEFDPKDVDFVMGSYFSDHLNQQLCMLWIVQDYLGLHRKPGYRVEAGGSTPMDALINAYYLIKSGMYDLILIVGWEWMSEVDTATTNEFIAAASDTDWDFTVGGYYNGYYACLETRRMQLFGDTIEDLAKVALKNYNNAAYNPYSQRVSTYGDRLFDINDYYNDRIVAWPYRRFNCALISEGAACILMASDKVAKKYTDSPMWIEGVGVGTDSMRPGDRLANWAYYQRHPEDEKIYNPKYGDIKTTYPEMANFGSLREAAVTAYKQAGIKDPLNEIDIAELFAPYDGVEISLYEDLMFVKRGEGKSLVRDGATNRDGILPCQTSGGLTAFCHPVGATSLIQTLFLYWELTEKIEEKFGNSELQIKNARTALTTGHGGTGCQGGVIIYRRD